jgi:cytochrome c oxidase subunit 1
VILIPTFLWSVGYIREIDTLMYAWSGGPWATARSRSTSPPTWRSGTLIAAVVFGAKPLSEKVSRTAFLLYILFLQLASAHHLLSDPGMSSEWKVVNTSYFMYFAVLASMIHGMTVPGAIEQAQRLKGFTKGLFEWLRKAPWGNPAFSGMFLSLIGFGFIGGISGVVLGTEQLNMLMHNTIYVPGHFHATVVIGTTLAFMASPTSWCRALQARDDVPEATPSSSPTSSASRCTSWPLVMMGAGTLGVSRRHWDMAFAGAPAWPTSGRARPT